MDRIAVLPARGGSKRLPRKNVKLFLGRPMITWPLRALNESGLFQQVIVSTDDPETGAIASSFGALAFDRDRTLSDDFSTTTQVVQAVINDYISKDINPWIYKIYPTSPVNAETVTNFVNFSEMVEEGFSVSVAQTRIPTQRALRMLDDATMEFREPEYALSRTQDLEPTYFDAGKMYAGRKHEWLHTESPLLSSARGFELPDWLSVDLDTVEDWELAEYKFRRKFGTN